MFITYSSDIAYTLRLKEILTVIVIKIKSRNSEICFTSQSFDAIVQNLVIELHNVILSHLKMNG